MEPPASEILRRRASPVLVVLTRDYRIASAQPGVDEFLSGFAAVGPCREGRLPPTIESAIRELRASWFDVPVRDHTEVICPTPDLAVRVTLMSGPDGICFAATLERIAFREDLKAVASRFRLSDRELTVLELIIRGLNAGQISARICVTENTVREHVKRIHRKLAVNSRAELVARALNWSDRGGRVPPNA